MKIFYKLLIVLFRFRNYCAAENTQERSCPCLIDLFSMSLLFIYRKIPNISPGLRKVCKHFLGAYNHGAYTARNSKNTDPKFFSKRFKSIYGLLYFKLKKLRIWSLLNTENLYLVLNTINPNFFRKLHGESIFNPI